MEKSNIQWTDATWNIARGCTKVDEDCKYCYMYRQSLNKTRYNPLEVTRTKTVFDFPLRYKETKSKVWDGPPLIFTSSLTDVFHPDIDSFRGDMWDIIRQCPHLTFQILTKRPERITEHLPADWGEGWHNVWLGTSVGSHGGLHRVLHLMKVKCKTRFLSMEPLHDDVDLNFIKLWQDYIHWVIVGGESGNEIGLYKYRPCLQSWILKIIDQCKSANIPVFVKQLGTFLATNLRLNDRHGGDMDEWPDNLKIREFPELNRTNGTLKTENYDRSSINESN
jgi:protein gp37